MRILTVALLAAAAAAAPALAAERCDVPQHEWRSADDLKTALTGKGWDVRNIKKEDGCYEVYAKNGAGKRVELLFDPATLEPVGTGSDD
jgi:hypothetical protein